MELAGAFLEEEVGAKNQQNEPKGNEASWVCFRVVESQDRSPWTRVGPGTRGREE